MRCPTFPLVLAVVVSTACADFDTVPTAPVTRPSLTKSLPGSGAAIFDYANASAPDPGGLVLDWRQHGVGNNNIDYTARVDHTEFEWGCFNGGSNHPSATNKEASSSPLTKSVSLEPRNGVIVGQITFDLPPAPSFCPPGQAVLLMSALYDGISLHDDTNSQFAPMDPTTVGYRATLPNGHGKNN